MKYVPYLQTGNWHDQWSMSILWLFLWPWPSVNFRLWPYSDVIFPMINICNMFSGIHCLQVNVSYVILDVCITMNLLLVFVVAAIWQWLWPPLTLTFDLIITDFYFTIILKVTCLIPFNLIPYVPCFWCLQNNKFITCIHGGGQSAIWQWPWPPLTLNFGLIITDS